MTPIRVPKSLDPDDRASRASGFPGQAIRVIAGMAIGASAVAVIVVSFAGSASGPDDTVLLPTPAAVTSTPSTIPSATPACLSAAHYIELIAEQERLGQWASAASTAEATMKLDGLCPVDTQLLAERAITNGLEALYAERFEPLDRNAQSSLLDRYLGLKRRAQVSGIPFPSPIQVGKRAYEIGQFLLATTCFEEGFHSDPDLVTNQQLIQQYTASLFNLGAWWSQGRGETRAQGLALLVASHHIDRKYQVGSGAAWGKLREVLGPDERAWPKPAPSPLLDGNP